jgi:hypothetical protein
MIITRRGSSLIEAMTATVILGCAVVVLLRSYVAAIAAAGVQQQYARAIMVLEEELDGILAKGFMERNTSQTYQKVVGSDLFEIKLTAEPVSGREINEVTVTVIWPPDSIRQRDISAVTYLLQPKSEGSVYAR